MKNYLRLLAYIKPYKKRLAAAVVCIIMAAGANLYLPWIIKDMIDDVLMSKDMLMLNLIAAGILVVMFTRGVFYYGQSYLVSYVGQRVIIDVRSVLIPMFTRPGVSFKRNRASTSARASSRRPSAARTRRRSASTTWTGRAPTALCGS